MRKNLIVVAALALLALPLAWAGDADSDRGFLGVVLHSTESIHDQDGHAMEEHVGLFVGRVLPGGAAELAGLQAKDKIVAIDGRDVSDMDGLHEAMESRRKGDRISVTVERDGREQSFDLELGEMPKGEKFKMKQVHVERFGGVVEGKDRAFVGIESQPVQDELAGYFGVEGGILVTKVIEDTPAELAGIEAGDVIVAWGEAPIRKVHDLHKAIQAAKPGDQVELSVSRRGAESPVLLTLGSMGDHKQHIKSLHREHFDEQHNRHIDVKVIEKKTGGE